MFSSLLSLFFPSSYPLFLPADKITAYAKTPYFGIARPPGPRVEVLPTQKTPAQAYAQIRKDLRPGGEDAWELGLPLKCFHLVNMHLPAAADDNLEEAVRYAMLRHMPSDTGLPYLAFARIPGGDELEVSAAYVDELEPILAALGQAGIQPAGIFPALAYVAASHGESGIYVSGGEGTGEVVVLEEGRIVFHGWDEGHDALSVENFLTTIRPMLENRTQPPKRIFTWEWSLEEERLCACLGMNQAAVQTVSPVFSRKLLEAAPFRISLVQPGLVRRRKLASRFRVVAAALFLGSLALFPVGGLLGKRAHLLEMEAEIRQIRPQAQVVAEKRLEVQDITEFLRNLARESNNQPMVLEMLLELTQILPSNAWLEAFSFSQNRVRIQGQAGSATSVIEALENSPLFRDVRLDAPVTKAGNRDVFQLSAELER